MFILLQGATHCLVNLVNIFKNIFWGTMHNRISIREMRYNFFHRAAPSIAPTAEPTPASFKFAEPAELSTAPYAVPTIILAAETMIAPFSELIAALTAEQTTVASVKRTTAPSA